MALLSTCHQIAHEAFPVIYATCACDLEQCAAHNRRLLPKQRMAIQSMEVYWNVFIPIDIDLGRSIRGIYPYMRQAVVHFGTSPWMVQIHARSGRDYIEKVLKEYFENPDLKIIHAG